MLIDNFDTKVFDAICDYENYNMYEDTTIEEYTRNEAENSPYFFSSLFDLEDDISFCELTNEQLSEYENLISAVVATYNEEYAEDEE